MAFIPTPLVAKAAIRGRLFNEDVVNTLWVENIEESEWDANSLSALAVNLESWWSITVMDLLSVDYVLADITTTAQFSNTAPSVVRTPPTVLVGGNLAGSLPGSCCFTLTFLSDARGRSFRGRNYISAIPVSEATDNQVEEAFAVGLRSAYAQLDLTLAGTGSIQVICSHYSNKQPRPSGVTVAVTGFRYHDLDLDSQRRRLKGRGS